MEGLTKIAGCENSNRSLDIVFVHGLGGDARSTWQFENAAKNFWPQWLSEDFADAGVWTLGYAADVSKWKEESMPLADRGNAILEQLSSEGLGDRNLTFITHSMGGIVVKQFLRHAESFGVRRWEAIANQTRGIAFIATPHSGANLANFASYVSFLLRTNEHVEELKQHDPRLRELHGWFLNFHQKHHLICRTYCEKREVHPEVLGRKLPKGILVVDETSAEPNIPGERAIPLDEDHISICKPKSRNADLYKSISRFIRECLDTGEKGEPRTQNRILQVASDALKALHDLDNAIRTTVGPLTRFDGTWSLETREKTRGQINELADTEEILPRVRQLLTELEEIAKLAPASSEATNAVAAVLACGRKTLELLGNSAVTPWPGPEDLAELQLRIFTSDSAETAKSVRQMAQKVLAVVDRELLRKADGSIGRWRGAI